MSVFAAHDGQFVNPDHIVTIELLQHTTGNLAGTWQVRARTAIAWGTGGYGHGNGHLVILGEKFTTEVEAREWVVKAFG